MASHETILSLEIEQWKHIERDGDLTIYWTWETAVKKLPELIIQSVRRNRRFDDIVFLKPPRDVRADPVKTRANIVRCGAGKWLSGTFRNLGLTPTRVCDEIRIDDWPQPAPNDFLIPPSWHADFLLGRLFDSGSAPQGAVVIAGATKCGKSVFATEFVKRLMQDAVKRGREVKSRFPHLVTYEDPIEAWELKTPSIAEAGKVDEIDLIDPANSLPLGMSVTARQKDSDVASLREALLDARRQTPACFFVGELRDERDWQSVLDFSGSGHLIVVTTHAASAREAMLRMLGACHAQLPAQRRQVAGFIKGIIHLEMPHVITSDGRKRKVLLPTLWTGTGSALNALVSSGASSLVPNGDNYLSREQYFTAMTDKMDVGSRLGDDRSLIRSRASALDFREITQR